MRKNMETKYIIGAIVAVIAVIGIAAFALGGEAQNMLLTNW